MKTVRTALTAAALCFLSAGYAASQWAVFTGDAADYAAKVDSPPVQTLSGLLLLAAIVLAFIPDQDQSSLWSQEGSQRGAGPKTLEQEGPSR